MFFNVCFLISGKIEHFPVCTLGHFSTGVFVFFLLIYKLHIIKIKPQAFLFYPISDQHYLPRRWGVCQIASVCSPLWVRLSAHGTVRESSPHGPAGGQCISQDRLNCATSKSDSAKVCFLLSPCVHCRAARTLPTSLVHDPGQPGSSHLGHQGQGAVLLCFNRETLIQGSVLMNP